MTAIFAPISMNTRPAQPGQFVDRIDPSIPAKSTNAIVALFQVLFSFGLLPLLLWPTRWAEFLESERHDLLDLVSWWRWRASAEDTVQLDKIAKRLRPRPILMVLPWLAVGFNVVLMATLLTQGERIDRIWDLTFNRAIDSHRLRTPALPAMVFNDRGRMILTGRPAESLPLERALYGLWMISLCLAYGCQWYAVRSHTVVVHSFVKWTNKFARQNRLGRIKNDALRIGLGPLWIGTGVLLCAMYAWWAIPMVFAGALQRRYSRQTSRAIRIALAGQASEASAMIHAGPQRFCKCGSRLPAPAKFCPRCGTAA